MSDMVILGVDYGQKRVGVAISDSEEILATPLKVLSVRGQEDAVGQVARLAAERDVGLIVVGLPYNMDGSTGAKAKETLEFVSSLRSAVGCDVMTWDERLSSFEAETALRDAGLSSRNRRARVDKVAAQVILSSFMESRRTRRADAADSTN